MNDLGRTPLSERAIAWAAAEVGGGARLARRRRLTGGITSAVHRLTFVDAGGSRRDVVLRRWVGDGAGNGPRLVAREADALAALEATGIPAPRVVGTDPDGSIAGEPALLMTLVPGHMHLRPRDPEAWLHEIAELMARVHATDLGTTAFSLRQRERSVPGSSGRPEVWRAAIAAMEDPPSDWERASIHHDFQHFNLLWRRERITGIVDWVYARSDAPPDVDVGHCRLNLAVLFSVGVAERFKMIYEAVSGRRVDPWWDLRSLLSYGDDWRRFIPIQAGRHADVDTSGMTERVEELVAIVLGRL